MDEEVKKWLADVLTSIKEINLFLPRENNFNDFQKDLKTKRAIERNLEIIGEAVNRILKIHPEIKITGAKQIIGLRNAIIHSYDNLSYENIWGVVTRHLPVLKHDVEKLLSE